jgi:two-component system OmpR family sensor kinase
VVDHGEGIPEPLQEKVFDRFYRADNSRNRETGGSGLGLAIARSIINAHGGKIWAEATPGGGATFSFEIPITQK